MSQGPFNSHRFIAHQRLEVLHQAVKERRVSKFVLPQHLQRLSHPSDPDRADGLGIGNGSEELSERDEENTGEANEIADPDQQTKLWHLQRLARVNVSHHPTHGHLQTAPRRLDDDENTFDITTTQQRRQHQRHFDHDL